MVSCNEAVVEEHQSRIHPRRSGNEPNRLEEHVRDSCDGKEEIFLG